MRIGTVMVMVMVMVGLAVQVTGWAVGGMAADTPAPAGAAGVEPGKQAPGEAEARKPLVIFVGDSITVGNGREDYVKSAPFMPNIGHGRSKDSVGYGYVEALCEATFGRDAPYRFDKRAAGGMSHARCRSEVCRGDKEVRIFLDRTDPRPAASGRLPPYP